ncbi:hypothetical protein F5J12DRAFT_785898 [Pisolithus orientalis]|uniref:uncharacterized protein n=1 Tax=Pisolithus orientalis TaxID=936130 RepID=UPI002224FAB0|nr:uncharacterized protein F5J12DRAFT_785898 [Pisolithus orientalis]KAI5994118.1 hypothetical protein F5J12DRAFT_785898 [Pisolithus orientalis]
MSANHLPCPSQLVHMATPDPIEAEKATLKEKFIAVSTALVTEARGAVRGMGDVDAQVTVFPIIKHGQELGVNTKVAAVAEANEAYERWAAEEVAVAAHGGADEDMQMGEEVLQDIREQPVVMEGPTVTAKMLHVKVSSHPVWKALTPKVVAFPADSCRKKGQDQAKGHCPIQVESPQGAMCTGPVGHMCDGWMQMKQGCKKSTKASGKKAQAGMSTVHEGCQGQLTEVEVVKSHLCGKVKAPVCSRLDSKVMADLSQLLRLLQAEAMELQAAYLHLQVHVNQLIKVLERIGVK